MLLIMRFLHATDGRSTRHFGGVRTPAASRCSMSPSKHGYATQAIAWANLDTEAPLTG
jgi:hypothetical protein